eukprot:366550-Chlamydomonas_euryale.AAC.11
MGDCRLGACCHSTCRGARERLHVNAGMREKGRGRNRGSTRDRARVGARVWERDRGGETHT